MYTEAEVRGVEDITRRLVKNGGILWSNVHEQNIVPDLKIDQVDIVTSVFCLESACSTYHEYCTALENIVSTEFVSQEKFRLENSVPAESSSLARCSTMTATMRAELRFSNS